jgi:hypothetical protein
MVIKVPKYDLTYMIPYKSGQNVLGVSIQYFLMLNNIEFQYSEHLIDKTNEYYIFTRHPIERFFSCYNWFIKQCLNNNDLNKIKNQFKIENVDDFFMSYKELIKICRDYHYLPQFSFFFNTRENLDINEFNINIYEKFQNNFTNYKLFKIEDLKKEIDYNDFILKTEDYKVDYRTNKIKKFVNDGYKFNFLKETNENINFNFLTIYKYFSNYFNITHHLLKNDENEMSKNNFRKLNTLFSKECELYGYDLKTYISKTLI